MSDQQTKTGGKSLCGRSKAAETSLWSRLSATVVRFCGRSPGPAPRAPVVFRAPRSVFLRAGAIFCAALVLAGCNTTSPPVQERVIAVPSSKPYRYIKPHPTEDKLSKDLLVQIERHNITHWKVKQVEAKAGK
jgi:hypothetical protein